MRIQSGVRALVAALMTVALVTVPAEVVDSFQYRYASHQDGISVDENGDFTDFIDNNSGTGSRDIRVVEVVMRNAGPNSLCFNLFKTTASVASCDEIVADGVRTEVFKRYAGGGENGRGYDGVAYITKTGETATLHVIASGVSLDPQ